MKSFDERRIRAALASRDIAHARRMTLVLKLLARLETAMVAAGHLEEGALRQMIAEHVSGVATAGQPIDDLFAAMLNEHFGAPAQPETAAAEATP